MRAAEQTRHSFATVCCQGLCQSPCQMILEENIAGAIASEWSPDNGKPLGEETKRPNHVCSLSLLLLLRLPCSSSFLFNSSFVLPLPFFPLLFLSLVAIYLADWVCVLLRRSSEDDTPTHVEKNVVVACHKVGARLAQAWRKPCSRLGAGKVTPTL